MNHDMKNFLASVAEGECPDYAENSGATKSEKKYYDQGFEHGSRSAEVALARRLLMRFFGVGVSNGVRV